MCTVVYPSPEADSVNTLAGFRAAFPERPLVWKPYVTADFRAVIEADEEEAAVSGDDSGCLCHVDVPATLAGMVLDVDKGTDHVYVLGASAEAYAAEQAAHKAERAAEQAAHKAERAAERERQRAARAADAEARTRAAKQQQRLFP